MASPTPGSGLKLPGRASNYTKGTDRAAESLDALLVPLPLACHAGVQIGSQPPVFGTLHEPVIASLVLWNFSLDVVEIDAGQSSEESYRVTITRPNGERVTAGKPLWAQGVEVLSPQLDEAGEDCAQTILYPLSFS